VDRALFSRDSLRLGEIHWYLLKADHEMSARRFRHVSVGSSPFYTTEQTDFGHEVGRDEIHWWVFRKEGDVEELRSRTERALDAAQALKASSRRLRSNPPSTYKQLVGLLRAFADKHPDEINTLHSYVSWLYDKDPLAPCILFTYRVWSATRLADRDHDIEATSPGAEDPQRIETLTEIVLGLLQRGVYTIDRVRAEIAVEIGEAWADREPEDVWFARPTPIPEKRTQLQTSYETLREFSEYFEFIRNSLQNILVDIEKYIEQRDLMKSDSFWRGFIAKAIASQKAEPQLWDFKETLEMWHVLGRSEEKNKAELKFAETAASFANTRGGVLIVGVSDGLREIKGIGSDRLEIERRLKFARQVLAEHLDCASDAIYFHQVTMPDKNSDMRTCLIVAIAQASSPVSVKDKDGRYSYPIRRETGFDRVDKTTLAHEKLNVKADNFDFIHDLTVFAYDR
jgi:hypothetical protein